MSTEIITQAEKIFTRFLEAVESLGKNKAEIAEIMGYSKAQVGDIIEGKAKLSGKFSKIFCATFGFSLEWLLTGGGEMYGKKANSSGISLSWDEQLILDRYRSCTSREKAAWLAERLTDYKDAK